MILRIAPWYRVRFLAWENHGIALPEWAYQCTDIELKQARMTIEEGFQHADFVRASQERPPLDDRL